MTDVKWERKHYTLSFYWKGEREPTPEDVVEIIRAQLGVARLIEDARAPQLESGAPATAYAPTLVAEEDEKDLKELQNILRPHGMDATLTSGPDPRVPPPLTGEEIAELRRVITTQSDGASPYVTAGGTMATVRLYVSDAVRLLDELDRARALLKRIEWSGVYDSGYGDRCHPCCPDCHSDAPGDGGDGTHAHDCKLAPLIGSAVRPPPPPLPHPGA